MNLHGIVSGAIGIVNPFVNVSLARSTGSTTAPDGTRTPTYATPVTISVQVQSLTFSDMRQMDSLNIQGTRRAMYIGAQVEAILRNRDWGGDMLTFPAGTFPEGDVWLAAHVLEAWPDWRKIALTLQVG
jgi:hypothetical protein